MKIINRETVTNTYQASTDNIILIDKPSGLSSFAVVKKIRSIGNFRKVGHAGTLDPLATGLLIIGTEKNTRLLTDISNNHKAYIARVSFGAKTDTYDSTGKISEKKDIEYFDITKIKEAIKTFVGETEQVAPAYSAKKVAGVRSYKLARKGKRVVLTPHKIKVFKFILLDHKENECDFYIECSKGTYIRSIANDLGIKTGYLAYLKELRRTKINGFSVENAISLEEFEKYWMGLN